MPVSSLLVIGNAILIHRRVAGSGEWAGGSSKIVQDR
jgi:hypothetical protein